MLSAHGNGTPIITAANSCSTLHAHSPRQPSNKKNGIACALSTAAVACSITRCFR